MLDDSSWESEGFQRVVVGVGMKSAREAHVIEVVASRLFRGNFGVWFVCRPRARFPAGTADVVTTLFPLTSLP